MSGPDQESDAPGETREERLNRELIELLNELRIAPPGVQVLFAFLLTVPFSGSFEMLGDAQRGLYFATFVGTAVATVLFMAPTAYHRIRFRQRDKERMIQTSNRFAIAGTIFLALSITSAALSSPSYSSVRSPRWASPPQPSAWCCGRGMRSR